MSKVTKLGEIVNCMNDAPSGTFVGITDYESEDGKVISVTGQIGFDYGNLKEVNMERLKALIELDEFEPVTVKGECNYDTIKGEWNASKKSMPVKPFIITYSGAEVSEIAKSLLEKAKTVSPRKSNDVKMSEKANGLVLNTATNNFNFKLLVTHETLKREATAKAQEGKEVKQKSSAPLTELKKAVRRLYEGKIKTFTIAEGKFEKLTINKVPFYSDKITL